MLLAAALVLSILAGEAVLRVLPTPRAHVLRNGRLRYRFNVFRPDGTFGYSLRPNWEAVEQGEEYEVTVHTGARGMRSTGSGGAIPGGARSILVVGDSFTFGFGVEDGEAFPARLERKRNRAGHPTRVWNAGVPGWCAAHYVVYLRERGFPLHPDLVLLALSENDIDDLGWESLDLDARNVPLRLQSRRRMIDRNGRMRYVNEGRRVVPDVRFPGSAWLATHSLLYHWIRFQWTRAAVAAAASREGAGKEEEGIPPPPEGPIEALSPDDVLRGLRSRPGFRLRYHRYLVEVIRHDCTARGIPLRILYIPARTPPSPESAEAELEREYASRPQEALVAGPFLSAERDYFPIDGHWNAEGHRRVAQRLSEWLLEDPELPR